jgi:hypothetical protein
LAAFLFLTATARSWVVVADNRPRNIA